MYGSLIIEELMLYICFPLVPQMDLSFAERFRKTRSDSKFQPEGGLLYQDESLQNDLLRGFGTVDVSASDLVKISHITCTSRYPHVCTSSESLSIPPPAQS